MHCETQSKNREFSRLSMHAHPDSGRADIARTLHDPRWSRRAHNASGMVVFDLISQGAARG